MHRITAAAVAIFALILWLRYFKNISRGIPMHYGTGFSLITLTFVAMGAWMEVNWWFLGLAVLVWLAMPLITGYAFSKQISPWSPLYPMNTISLLLVLFSLDYPAQRGYPLILSAPIFLVLFVIFTMLLKAAFPRGQRGSADDGEDDG